jgi:serine kinase of HPr protein (carbohydrate metabolism regulator)
MTAADAPTIHASAVQVGDVGILIRGPSGSGKSRLAFDLMLAGRAGQIAPTLLVGDDRLHLAREGARLLVRPAEALRGQIEIRGLGIRRCDHVATAAIGFVVDLAASDATRYPDATSLQATLEGVFLPRIPVGISDAALPLVLAALLTSPAL